jgi:DNA transformation protein and related proteins
MQRAFAKAGIVTADALRDLGTEGAWKRLIASGYRPHFMAYLALEMGLQNRPINAITTDQKAALRRRFDALNADISAHPLSGIEAELDRLGLPRNLTHRT